VNRTEKSLAIKAIKEVADKASIAILSDFKGMTVEELTLLRVELHKAGGEYLVVKNTLGRIAFTDGKHDCLGEMFKDNSGIAFGYEDAVTIAKALTDFAKTNKNLKIRQGSLEGKLMDAAMINSLAKLPSRDELLGQVLGTMNAVPTNLVSLFANVIRGMLYALKAIEEKKTAA